ncbi:T9SS type A sorting domain-containing protein, partial [Flavobacterium sp.]|uniref:T9SS type A sorting domain-containing protein n=1 Tax=Flavobacterium sp. TaxID=239 RepID=UPI002FD9D486
TNSSIVKVLTIGTGYSGNIQWQRSTDLGVTYTDIVGETSQSYTITNPVVGANYFRAKFSNGCTEVIGAAKIVYYKDCGAKAVATTEVVKTPFAVVAYPNPYSENFNLSLTTTSEDSVGVVIYDMTGRLIDQREVKADEVSTLQIGDRYPSGVYNVIVTQGSEVKTLRVIKR